MPSSRSGAVTLRFVGIVALDGVSFAVEEEEVSVALQQTATPEWCLTRSAVIEPRIP